MFNAKNFLPLLLVLLLASCSSKKDIPQGKRISIIDTPELSYQAASKKADIELSSASEVKNWYQIGSNEQHLIQNILMAKETQKRLTIDFGQGSSKRNLLLASPVSQNGIIYTQDTLGTVRAFDLKSGEQVFKQKLKPLNKNDSSSGLNGAGLALHGNKLYALAGFGGIFALDASDGHILWRQDLTEPIRTAPSIANNMLFVQTINNLLIAFSLKDGSEIWRYSISAEDTIFAGGASPAIDSNRQIIVNAFSNGDIQAFNTKIGYPIWSQNLVNTNFAPSSIHALKASPVIEGKTVYAAGSNDKMIAADVETGDILWQMPFGGMSTPLVDKTALFIVTNTHELLALDKKTGKLLWQTPLLDDMSLKDRRSVYIFSPLLINGHLLITTSNGWLLRFNAKTGTFLSEDYAGEELAVQPIVVNGNLILTTKNAKIIIFK